MATPMFEQGLTLKDVLDLSADELKQELTGRDIDAKGMSKVEMQKAFIKFLFPFVPVAPVVAQPVSPRTALSPQQIMELEVMRLKMESEEREKRLRFELEALERKEASEKEKEAIERQEKAAALEKRERREEQDRHALEKKEAIEREEKAVALRKQEKQEAIEREEKAEALRKQEEKEVIERQEKAAALERKERRDAIEDERKAALLERKIEAEETATKLKLDIEDRKIRENRAIEESKLKLELQKLEMDDKEKARQHEINLKRLDQNLSVVSDPIQNDSFRLSAAIKFVPPFDDVDMTQFLNAFENAMAIHNFPKDKWTQLIHTKLTGKAQKVFAELGVEACLDYDTLKAALLLAYERVPEFHRKRFRTLNKFGNETYSNFAFRLALPFNSWIEGEEASTDIVRLKEVMKLEQFTNCLPTEIHRWVVE